MDFLDDICNTVTETVNKAAKKTEDIASITKNKIKLAEAEDRLSTLYAKLGKLHLIELRKNSDKSEEKEVLIAEIYSCIASVKELRAAINEITNK